MTSFLSTGGLRGAAHEAKNFQLRSFNMGLSKEAFLLTGGFSKQRIGEDIDLNYRLKEKNISTRYIADAFVYHKRRTSWFLLCIKTWFRANRWLRYLRQLTGS